LTDLDDRLTLAFADLFAENRIRFRDGEVSGGPGYYSVRVAALTKDGAEVELAVTFRKGVKYCCFESACHASYYRQDWWVRLQKHMDGHGLGHLPLPIVRTFRGVVECGAVAEPGTNPPACFVCEGSEYRVGPWYPIAPKQAEQLATDDRAACGPSA